MIARPADGGGGYVVDAHALRSFAHTADGVDHSVQGLAERAQSALAQGVPGGLDIGAAIARAQGTWGARLKQLGGQAQSIGASLAANAASYDETESTVRESVTRVLRDGGFE